MTKEQREIFDLKDVGIPEIPLVGRYAFSYAREPLSEHVHAGCMEICYLLRGQQSFRFNRTCGKPKMLCRMQAGDLFISMPDETHDSAGLPLERGELLWMQIHLERKKLLGLTPQKTEQLRTTLLRLPARHFSGNSRIRQLFSDLHTHAARQSRDNTLYLCALCQMLLLEIAAAAKKNSKEREISPLMEKALAHIQDETNRNLSVQMLANECGVSESWLLKNMMRVTGLTPGDYILRDKINKACQLLEKGHGVTNTAHELGFSSSQYFATVFKRFHALTPSMWVKKNQTDKK